MTDAHLLRQLRSRDQDQAETAWSALFRQFYAPLVGVTLRGYVVTPTEAEDIVQSVFLHLWHERRTVATHGDLAALLHRRLRHDALDWLESRQFLRLLSGLPDEDV